MALGFPRRSALYTAEELILTPIDLVTEPVKLMLCFAGLRACGSESDVPACVSKVLKHVHELVTWLFNCFRENLRHQKEDCTAGRNLSSVHLFCHGVRVLTGEKEFQSSGICHGDCEDHTYIPAQHLPKASKKADFN